MGDEWVGGHVFLLVAVLPRRSKLVQDCLPTLPHLLLEGALLVFQRPHSLAEHITLLLRERAETLVLRTLRLFAAAMELAGSPAMSTGAASMPHGFPAVAHGPPLMSPTLPLGALGSIHVLANP